MARAHLGLEAVSYTHLDVYKRQMFLLTWLGAVVFWRVGHVEQKWGSRLRTAGDSATPDHAVDGGTRAA